VWLWWSQSGLARVNRRGLRMVALAMLCGLELCAWFALPKPICTEVPWPC
jgi:hypothetical protein